MGRVGSSRGRRSSACTEWVVAPVASKFNLPSPGPLVVWSNCTTACFSGPPQSHTEAASVDRVNYAVLHRLQYVVLTPRWRQARACSTNFSDSQAACCCCCHCRVHVGQCCCHQRLFTVSCCKACSACANIRWLKILRRSTPAPVATKQHIAYLQPADGQVTVR